MPVNGKQKGNSYERKISKLLSERFEPVLGIPAGFRRSSDSGSFFGGTNVSRAATYNLDKATFGDIVCPNNFVYSIECKHYKTPPAFSALIKGKVQQWDTWLSQATQDAKSGNKEMLLVVKYNNVDTFVFLDKVIEGEEPIFKYSGYFVYNFDTWLKQKDEKFFTA